MARYVKTATAREAVKGREVEIIQKSGVDWLPGQRGHITCPYHGGSGDWRFDEAKGLCYCTCLEKPHSVFDHLSKMRGDDPKAEEAFERSKIEAVESLGRTDLIEGEDKAAGKKKPRLDLWHRFFQTDRLRNPPDDIRDDSLVRTYLAKRQGVAPEDAVLPTSPYVGLKKLEFIYESKVVAECPCAVFFQVNPNDPGEVTGGIRIYLNEDGTGKADLRRPDGSAHDVKPMTTGSKVGGAVLYGNPETAAKQVTCEGVETGGSIAIAARHRGDGAVLVACGGNASFMQGVRVRNGIGELFVACDRDEKPNDKGNVSKTGEKAGLHIAAKHADGRPVHLALPGAPGSKTDWLDVLIDAGPDAVYDGVFGAPAYEMAANQQNRADMAAAAEPMTATDLASILRLYPIPTMITEEFRYDNPNGDNEWWLYRKKLKKNQNDEWEETWVPVCTPFAVTRRLVLLDGADGPNYALRLTVQGMSGQLHEIDVSRSLFAKSGAADLKSLMFKSGLRTEGDGDNVAVSILKSANPTKEVRVLVKPGWNRIVNPDAPIFVSPTGEIIGDPGDQEVELTVNSRIKTNLRKSGDLAEWLKIAELIPTIPRTQHWSFALMAGFAGVLVDLLGMDTCGICFTGDTTRGKSTAQMIMASPWSNPESKFGALNHSAKATTNAIEPMAQRSSGTVFGMDDLRHMKGEQISAFTYMISGGTGKSRMNADSSLKASYSWQTFVSLSAEHTLKQAIEEGGGEWLPGISVRIPDINVSNVDDKVPPETMSRINGIKTHFGHAGPVFVKALIDGGLHVNSDGLQRRIDAVAAKLAGEANSELRRAAIPFAIVACAGEMAKKAGILPETLDVGATINWGWNQFRSNNEGTGGDRKDEALDSFNAWISRNWNLTVVSKAEAAPKREVEAWYDQNYIYVKKDTLEKVLKQAITVTDFVNRMKAMDLLVPNGTRNVHKYTPGLNIGTCYWLKRPTVVEADGEERLDDTIAPGVGPSPEEVLVIERKAAAAKASAEEKAKVVSMSRYGRGS